MKIEAHTEGDVRILALDGRLIAGTGDVVLRDAMNRVVAEGWTKVLLDLSRIKRIDSAGIGELMASRKLAQRFGSEIRLLNVEGQVHHILEMGQLLPLFTIYSDQETAVAEFSSAEAKADA
ncbi:MAG: STAS domain-containing protein [Thermoanaerobaculia bacterium]|nr:STAS domain-containing protein [Thermoanaerobaculia bacterium]